MHSMKVIDRGLTITLADDDPRAEQIRVVLSADASKQHPITTLWNECSNEQRAVLASIASAGEITQEALEKALGDVTATNLRARNIGLSKIAKRVGVPYPIRTTGGRREYRRFTLASDVARQILRLNAKTAKMRHKP